MAAKFMRTKKLIVPLVTIALALSTIVAVPVVSCEDMAGLLSENIMVSVEMQEHDNTITDFQIVQAHTSRDVYAKVENIIQDKGYQLTAEKKVNNTELAKRLLNLNGESTSQEVKSLIIDIINA